MGVNRLKKWVHNYPIYAKGSNWCSLTREAVELLLSRKKDIHKMTRFTNCPDEVYKQIILLNSRLKCINNDLRFTDWRGMIHHPRIINSTHFESIKNSDAIFARKFDLSVDSDVIDKINSEILFQKI